MNITSSDIDTITMLRFEPIRGSDDYRCGMHKVKVELVKGEYDKYMVKSNKIARGICESFKTKR